MPFFTYIIYSKSKDKYYIGYCSDINNRLEKHNAGATKSTKTGRPWELKYYETFDNKTDAIKRENEIKGKKSRIYIEQLIENNR